MVSETSTQRQDLDLEATGSSPPTGPLELAAFALDFRFLQCVKSVSHPSPGFRLVNVALNLEYPNARLTRGSPQPKSRCKREKIRS